MGGRVHGSGSEPHTKIMLVVPTLYVLLKQHGNYYIYYRKDFEKYVINIRECYLCILYNCIFKQGNCISKLKK